MKRALLTLLALGLSIPAGAVITRLYPLGDVIADADLIAVAQVTARDTKQQSVTLKRVRTLKGKAPWSAPRLRLAGGDDRSQAPVLAARLSPGRQVVVFTKNGKFSLGYVEGTWFRIGAPANDGAEWPFVHLEPYLRRTFRGTGAELQKTVAEVLAGKGAAPPPDPDAKPGVGNP
jgi:hypothetical protein